MAVNSQSPANSPFAILGPPDAVPSAKPTSTRAQQLPFEELSWENFERLCHRLTALDGNIEHCARYGHQGQAQEGIDIFARLANGHYHCLQSKRHRSFGASAVREAVDLFLAGTWATRAVRFTIAVQASLRSTLVQEEIEAQAVRLTPYGIAFEALDGEALTDRLRTHPNLIDDFFGRHWVEALLGEIAAKELGPRLDGAAFARVRAQLARVYEAHFQFVDPGSFGSVDEGGQPALTLLDRFLRPDILVRETVQPHEPIDAEKGAGRSNEGTPAQLHVSGAAQTEASIERTSVSRVRRLPLAEWFGDAQHFVVVGDAGSGKSTLLRVIALDLLRSQEHFPELATSWGQHIPVYVPFARWSSQAAKDGNAIGIKEIVRRWLEPLLTGSIVDLLDRAIDEERVLLLIDGLDEWSSEQAARSTLHALVTTVEAHNIPAIVSGRPRGLSRIGALPSSWKRGTVAPLSTSQQATIAGRWFERYAAKTSEGSGQFAANLRTSRFMAELSRDANLGTLASVPLLLIGLVTLAIRGQILPRTRSDAYDQLIRILLEIHPVNRATASGDTESRFRYATDPVQRRAAIAKLAFAAREQTGGAGLPLGTAQEVLSNFLASPQGYGLTEANADAAAAEILSVNAETQGLLIEKAFGEVGFVHASFEEFLAAEFIGSLPFSEIEMFVQLKAGEGQWRSVITNILSRIRRRDEFERLVNLIEEPAPDELAGIHRQFLLGDIATAAAAHAPMIAKRLVLETMHRVENEDWLPARREALAAVLRALPDPALRGDPEQRLRRWLPARSGYRLGLIRAFGTWRPTSELQDLLFRAMHDEDRRVQRSAAATYAKVFSASKKGHKRLLDGLAGTRNLSAAAALLESLAHGWSSAPGSRELFEEAWHSNSPDLRLVGILGLASTGVVTDEAREVALVSQNFWSDVSGPYRELAVALLMKYWPGDEALIKSALLCVARNWERTPWEHSSATAYLLESPTDHAQVRAWILSELGGEHPFVTYHDVRAWHQVGRFAVADPLIRAAANRYWCEPKNRLINMHRLPSYVVHVADPAVAAVLVQMLRDVKEGFSRHWALRALLTGWGRNHPDVKPAMDELVGASDDYLRDLTAGLPEAMPDKAMARRRLINLGTQPEVRRDLLAVGLEVCGCSATDLEAVAAILAVPEKLRGGFDPSYTLFRTFGSHAAVRAIALERVQEAAGPFEAIAAGYVDDPEFATPLFEAATPLPVDLRTQIVEVAASGGTGTALELVLSKAQQEHDPELRARMVIAYHRALPVEARNVARQALLAQATTIGGDFEADRAVALAGLVSIDELPSLAKLEDRGDLVRLETGTYLAGVPTVERLVCERFADFEAAFGDSLAERFTSPYKEGRLAHVLSVASSASPSARAAFLAFAERGEIPLTARALRALGAERPRSELLLARCWDALDKAERHNGHALLNADIGVILREHFQGDANVRDQLVVRYKKHLAIADALPLAIFAPEAKELPFPVKLEALGRELGDWALAIHVAAKRSDCDDFRRLVEAMIRRRRRTQFDAQQITNLAIVERLQWDTELEAQIGSRIAGDVYPSISGSAARFLATTGKLRSDSRGRALDLLQALGKDQTLPVAGYDAIADEWRAARATLLDAISAGIELG